jgi:hypothetical protein
MADDRVVLSPLEFSFLVEGCKRKRNRSGRRVRVYVSVAPELMAHILSFLRNGQLALMRRVSRDVRAHIDYEFQRRRLLGHIYRPKIATAMTSPSLLKDYMRYSASVRRAGDACRWDMIEKWCLLLWDPKNGYRCKHVCVYSHAIRDGNTAMLEWLISEGRIRVGGAFACAAHCGSIRIYEWLKAHYFKGGDHRAVSDIMSCALNNCRMDMVRHLEADRFVIPMNICKKWLVPESKDDARMAYLHRGKRCTWPCEPYPCAWARTHRSDASSEQ